MGDDAAVGDAGVGAGAARSRPGCQKAPSAIAAVKTRRFME